MLYDITNTYTEIINYIFVCRNNSVISIWQSLIFYLFVVTSRGQKYRGAYLLYPGIKCINRNNIRGRESSCDQSECRKTLKKLLYK